jgi:MFS family permease
MHDPDQKPTNVRWVVFALACSTSWLLYLHRYVFALIKPRLAEEWGLESDALGLLDGVFFLFYTIFQVPLGVAADVWGVRLVLTGLIVLWTAGLGMHAAATSSAQMWCARALLGIGQSAVFATLNRISRQWFPLAIRTTLQGFVGVLAGRAGGLSAYLLFGSLLVGVFDLPWRTAVGVFVAIGLAHAVIFFFVFRNSPREHPRVNEAEAALIEGGSPAADASSPARMTVGQMLRSLTPRGLANLVALTAQTTLSAFADNIYSNWIPLFLWQVHRLEFKEMGIYSSLPLFGGAIAGVVGGMLNDLFISRTGNRRWSRSGVAFVGKGMAAVLLLIALAWYDSPYVFCGFLFFVKLFGDWSLTTSWGVVTDIGGRATASVFALNNSVAGIGSMAAPVVFGLLAKSHGWYVVFVAVCVTYALCALSWLVIDCTIPLIEPAPDGNPP